MDIEVRVPATVANLGPGFDCLGVAIGVYLVLRMSAPASEEIEIAGVGPIRPAPENLTYKAFSAACEAAGEETPPIRIETTEVYPSARGMGASASAIVAGLVGARHGLELDLTDQDLARLAVSIEGHSDNVLPALFGGLVLHVHDGWMRFDPHRTIQPVILSAPDKFKTEDARRVLPVEVPRADAVLNASATAALIAVITGHQTSEALLYATEDRIHQPYRLPLMQGTLDLYEGLRGKGIATALAGSGPSLICLVHADNVSEVTRIAADISPGDWQIMTPGWDLDGAQVR